MGIDFCTKLIGAWICALNTKLNSNGASMFALNSKDTLNFALNLKEASIFALNSKGASNFVLNSKVNVFLH